MTLDLNYHPGRPAPISRGRASSFRVVSENNPCYLLSAACMLLGLRILAKSFPLIALIATLNFYETMLIAMALWLIVQRKIERDGEILLAIEALFLADTALLSSELFTSNFTVGLIVNAVLLLLTAGKLSIIAMMLKIGRTIWPMIALQAMVLAVPGLCKWASQPHGGKLPEFVLYGAWWLTLFVPMLFKIVYQTPLPALARRVSLTFAALLSFSVVLHLGVAGWVYMRAWYPAHLAPLILGMVIAIKPKRWRVLAPLAAVVVSLATPDGLAIGTAFTITPLRCALIGAACVHAMWFITDRKIRFAAAAMIDLLIALLGATGSDIIEHVRWPIRTALDGADRFVPSTLTQWGLVSIACTFVLLILGMVISVNRRGCQSCDSAQEKARS